MRTQDISELIEYFKDKPIKNIHKLIKILESNETAGHIIHAKLVKSLYEDRKFNITDIEKKQNKFDIDIELNNSINIQVWHGASYSTHRIIETFKNKPRNDKYWKGSIETDWDKDKNKIRSKLNQLPQKKLGLLICYNNHLGIVILPDWTKTIPDNKAIIELYLETIKGKCYPRARIYNSDQFKYLDITKEIVSSLGFSL